MVHVIRVLCPFHGVVESIAPPAYSDDFSGDIPCGGMDFEIKYPGRPAKPILTIELKDGVVKSLFVKP